MRALRPWVPSGLMMLVSLISYIDRNALAQLSPTILKAAHLTNEDYGWIVAAFSIAYMLGNIVWGRVLDRVGPFIGMLAAVTLWSMASASHALMMGFAGFAIARAFLGIGEGATFPGGLRTATQTLPPERRARGIAIAYSGGSLGAIVTPIVITPIAARWGWRGAFVATGLLGASWLMLWLLAGGRTPSLRAVPPPDEPGERPHLGDARLWGFMALYALGAFPLGFVLYAAPLYLNQSLHLTQTDLGQWLWIPPLGWELGYFFWGWLVDRRATAPIRTRDLFSLVLLSLPLAFIPTLTSRLFGNGLTDVRHVHRRRLHHPRHRLRHARLLDGTRSLAGRHRRRLVVGGGGADDADGGPLPRCPSAGARIQVGRAASRSRFRVMGRPAKMASAPTRRARSHKPHRH
jgi:ACS family hexuronate transporter-like MFS transporter